MRLPIREQLALLVLTTSLTSLAIISSSLWINSENSIKGQTLSTLSLTASLKASQLSSNLNVLQSIVQAEATRSPLQIALQNYEYGNVTAADWEAAHSNLGVTLGDGGITALLLQARVFPKDASGPAASSALLNVTGQARLDGQLLLGYNYSSGKEVFLGDPGPGYPSVLYPNLTYASKVVNNTINGPLAFSDGVPLYLNSSLLLGPLQVNASFALISLTVPVISNAAGNIIGWLTIVIDGVLLYEVVNSNKGLRSTGIVLLVGPDVPGNQFPSGWGNTTDAAEDYPVRYVLPPTRNSSRGIRHSSHQGPFSMQSYPAVLDAFTASAGTDDNEGSLLSTYNEDNASVSVGYAVTQTTFCDWALLVEQAHSEVVAPLHHFRQIILACVLGTTGGFLLISFPIAHFSVRPIRRLCAATRLSVTAPSSAGGDGSSSYAAVNEGENPTHGIEKENPWIKLFGRRWREQTTTATAAEEARANVWRIPGKVQETKHFVQDELTDLTKTFNEMTAELSRQYENLESRVQLRTQELEISKKAAEAANESKTLFIANMSHELKTPLNGILGMCALCMQEEDQREIKRSVSIIQKSGDLLLSLLTDILTFSKNQAGQGLSLDESEFRLADMSSQVTSIFRKQAKDSSINLRVSFHGWNQMLPASGADASLEPQDTERVRDVLLLGDEQRILQVIINLVSNGLKFNHAEGSVEVRFTCLGCIGRKTSTPARRTGSKRQMQSNREGNSSLLNPNDQGNALSHSRSFTSLSNNDQEAAREDTSLEPLRQRSVPGSLSIDTSHIMFECEVKDTGPGIPENQQERIFESFVQGDLGLAKKHQGTGLGLSICSQLVRLLRGTLTLESEVGVGSTFTMRVPLRLLKEQAGSPATAHGDKKSLRGSLDVATEIDEDTTKRDSPLSDFPVRSQQGATSSRPGSEIASIPALSSPGQRARDSKAAPDSTPQHVVVNGRADVEMSPKNNGIRVLVAEDNKVNQEVILRMLKLEKLRDVTVANDGQEAFDLVKESMAQQNLFHIIFMDIQMPNVDGLQSTRLIRSVGYSAPVVALTAFSEESNVKECMDAGMDHFIPKPIRRAALKQVLNRFCCSATPTQEHTATNGNDSRTNEAEAYCHASQRETEPKA
ncbi:hypothetical protein LTR62_002251 [Meristemomyces frigidus]|uniref:histidine kinase n=1 Tax=Meristemomyces frigidus TaxID=1508187 RepID=A0AAN7YHN0_9PEZI|nr:hypothetical protein LTR62_002251 [Meristemomyces frigidus]